MRLILDLTDEEIEMICSCLEIEGDKIMERSHHWKNEKERDKYYDLAERFRKSGQKIVYYVPSKEE